MIRWFDRTPFPQNIRSFALVCFGYNYELSIFFTACPLLVLWNCTPKMSSIKTTHDMCICIYPTCPQVCQLNLWFNLQMEQHSLSYLLKTQHWFTQIAFRHYNCHQLTMNINNMPDILLIWNQNKIQFLQLIIGQSLMV